MRRSRILIQNTELRKLFWVGEKKESLYVGSYLSTDQYQIGSFVKPPKHEIHVRYSKGKIVDLNRNTTIKITFHPSGEVHAKTQDNKSEYIWTVKREKLFKINGCKHLGFFLPKEAVNYPILRKTRKQDSNFILPTKIFNQKPFVVSLYLAERSFNPKQLISPKMENTVVVGWERVIQFILVAYQTDDIIKEGVFPPKECWVFPT